MPHYALLFSTGAAALLGGASAFSPSPFGLRTLSNPSLSPAPCPPGCPCCAAGSATRLHFQKPAAHAPGCGCGLCGGAAHGAGCACPSCAGSHAKGCGCAACAAGKACAPGCSCSSCRGLTSLMSSYLDDISSPDSAPDQAPPAASVEASVEASVPPAVAAADDSDASPSASHALERPAGPDATKAKRPKRASKPAPTADMVGSTLTGTVRTVMPYGAFVDVGRSSDGLVHISRVRDDFVADVAEVLSVGDEVSVRVISVDLDKKQIALSMLSEESEAAAAATRGQGKRRPQRSGGDRAAQGKALAALAGSGYSDELFVEGSVVSTLPFGAFVRFSTQSLVGTLEGELDGLVHISALSKDRVDSVEAVCNVGDSVKVRVKDVDVEGGKISLSMINKEDEPAPRRGGGGAGGKRGPRIEERFTESEMGAKDWKESMEEFNTSQGTFSNNLMMKKTN